MMTIIFKKAVIALLQSGLLAGVLTIISSTPQGTYYPFLDFDYVRLWILLSCLTIAYGAWRLQKHCPIDQPSDMVASRQRLRRTVGISWSLFVILFLFMKIASVSYLSGLSNTNEPKLHVRQGELHLSMYNIVMAKLFGLTTWHN